MTSHTLGTAAKATGKDRATISRAIKKGKISAVKGTNGQWKIDPAELHRVYPPLEGRNSAHGVAMATPDNTEILAENSVLKVKLEAMQQRADALEDDKQFLQGELKKATTLLTDQRPRASETTPERPKGFLGWFRTRN